MSTKKTIIINAISNDGTSKGIKTYLLEGYDKPKGRFVMRLDPVITTNGNSQTRMSNFDLGIVVSHNPQWLEESLTGFRRKSNGVTYIVAELGGDVLPSVKELTAKETF
jgi:hypothetical protein